MIILFLTMFLSSLEDAGVVEGVAWMNYFLVVFTALPLICLLAIRVSRDRGSETVLSSCYTPPGGVQEDST